MKSQTTLPLVLAVVAALGLSTSAFAQSTTSTGVQPTPRCAPARPVP